MRTLFLCDYFSNTGFRRELHTLLNRGESVHQLERAIYTGKVAPERGRRRDEMIAISGSLTLLPNLVIAWNTQRMQGSLQKRENIARQAAACPRLLPTVYHPLRHRSGNPLVLRANPCQAKARGVPGRPARHRSVQFGLKAAPFGKDPLS